MRDRILVLLLGHLLDADRRDALTDLRQRLSEVEGGARERLGRGGGR